MKKVNKSTMNLINSVMFFLFGLFLTFQQLYLINSTDPLLSDYKPPLLIFIVISVLFLASGYYFSGYKSSKE